MQIANAPLKWSSTSLIIKKMQIKIITRNHLTIIRITTVKSKPPNKQEIKSVGKDVEKFKHLFTVGGNVKWYRCSRKQYSVCVCVCVCAQSCPTLCNTLDCSPPGSSVHGFLQARILEWVAISPSRGSSQLRDRTWVSYVSCIAGIFFTPWVIREAQENSIAVPQKIKNWTIVWSGNSTLGIYPKELKARSHIEFCTPMFIATLFTVAKI